jgi:hypothetical protein
MLANAEATVTAGVVSGVAATSSPRAAGRRLVPRHDPDGRVHQPGQQRRPAGERAGPGHRRELVHHLGQRRQRRPRLRHPHRPRAAHGRRTCSATAASAARGSGSRSSPTTPNRWGRSRQVRVARVAPGSPAATAGVQPGMIITAPAAGRSPSPLDWEARLLDTRMGETVELAVLHDGRQRTHPRRHGGPAVAGRRARAGARRDRVGHA